MGNQDSCSFSVTVIDTASPVIVCPLDSTVVPPTSCNYQLPDLTSLAFINDNCTASGSIGMTQSPLAGTILNGNTLITLTANDGNGNTANCSFNLLLDLNLLNVNAGPDTTICGDSIPLSGSDPGTGTGTWTVSQGTGTFSNPNNRFSMVTGLGPGLNRLVWSVSNGNCMGTDIVQVINATNSLANVGNDTSICGPLYQLNAWLPGGSSGQWSVLSGNGIFTNDSLPDTQVSNLSSGPNQFQWRVTLGTCIDSALITVTSFDSVFADADPNDTVCGFTGTLSVVPPTTGSGRWSVFNGSGNIGAPDSAATTVTGLDSLLNQFQWTVVNGVCADSAITALYSQGTLTADAGIDQTVCGPMTILNATLGAAGSGQWSVISGSGSFVDPTLENTTVNNLNPGSNLLQWTFTHGNCTDFDQVEIFSWEFPDLANAGPDQQVGISSTVFLAANDPLVGKGLWTQLSGPTPLTFLQDTLYNTQVTGFVGGARYELGWTIENGACPPSFDQMILEISDLVIPEVITANGDGQNDTWRILGLENYDQVKVSILNRWGNRVYTTDNYQNDWAGTNVAGKELTDDTYYYLLEISIVRNLM